jgi:hypothetical protein
MKVGTMTNEESARLDKFARQFPNTDRETLRAALDLMDARAAVGEQGDLDSEQYEAEQLFLATTYKAGAPRISGNGA